MEDLIVKLGEVFSNPDVQKALGVIVMALINGVLLDTLHDVMKGIEKEGSKTAVKGNVSKQTSWARPWTKVVVGMLKVITTAQEKK